MVAVGQFKTSGETVTGTVKTLMNSIDFCGFVPLNNDDNTRTVVLDLATCPTFPAVQTESGNNVEKTAFARNALKHFIS